MVAHQADSDARLSQANFFVAHQADSDVQASQLNFLTAYRLVTELEASTAGGASVSGVLLVYAQGELSFLGLGDVGTSSVTGDLEVVYQLEGQSDGVASLFTYLGSGLSTIGPIPYQVGYGGAATQEVSGTTSGATLVSGDLEQVHELVGAIAGAAVVSLSSLENIPVLQGGSSSGSSTVSGALSNGVDDGAGNVINDLAGVIAGTSTVGNDDGWLFLTFDPPATGNTYLYMLQNTGVGFVYWDDVSARSDFVSQTQPDGDPIDFDEFLYMLQNTGVGFGDLDDVSSRTDFVSQTLPDLYSRDYDEFLYLLLLVIAGQSGLDRLIVYPGSRDGKPFIPDAKPPSGRFL